MTLKTSLEHLPEAKRAELDHVVRVLFEAFEDAVRDGRSDHKRDGRILKIILYGSYARGDWVSDPIGGYFSDYDILVVVNDEKLTDIGAFWADADERLMREHAISRRLSAPVNFIVHALGDVNGQLRRGRPFFVDIARDGVALFEAPGHPFDKPSRLAPADALAEARGYFDEWFLTARQFYRQYEHAIADDAMKLAAFDLHQATERLYHCLLLVLTLYSPKSHKLNFLRSQGEQLAPGLAEVWPRASRFEQRCFELLRRAYVDARYSPHYRISAEELAWIGARVADLQGRVRSLCEARISALEAVAGSGDAAG